MHDDYVAGLLNEYVLPLDFPRRGQDYNRETEIRVFELLSPLASALASGPDFEYEENDMIEAERALLGSPNHRYVDTDSLKAPKLTDMFENPYHIEVRRNVLGMIARRTCMNHIKDPELRLLIWEAMESHYLSFLHEEEPEEEVYLTEALRISEDSSVDLIQLLRIMHESLGKHSKMRGKLEEMNDERHREQGYRDPVISEAIENHRNYLPDQVCISGFIKTLTASKT